jgi:hypothetical protein
MLEDDLVWCCNLGGRPTGSDGRTGVHGDSTCQPACRANGDAGAGGRQLLGHAHHRAERATLAVLDALVQACHGEATQLGKDAARAVDAQLFEPADGGLAGAGDGLLCPAGSMPVTSPCISWPPSVMNSAD